MKIRLIAVLAAIFVLAFGTVRQCALADGNERELIWSDEFDGTSLERRNINVVEDIVNVPTNAGFELPFTGGMGTVWFTVSGVLLIGGATLLLIRQRRSRA